MIRNLIFDMGGVLIHWEPEHLLDILEVPSADRPLLRREVFGSVEWIQTDRGTITLEQAVTLERVREQGEALLLPVDRFFAAHPACRLPSPRQERLCRNGNPVPMQGLEKGMYRVYGQDGAFLCLSRWEDGYLFSVKNFFQ